METYCRPQAFLPNPLKKYFPAERNLLPSSPHKSASFLYQFLVLTKSIWFPKIHALVPRNEPQIEYLDQNNGLGNPVQAHNLIDIEFCIILDGVSGVHCDEMSSLGQSVHYNLDRILLPGSQG
jgi:hypothetical protein